MALTFDTVNLRNASYLRSIREDTPLDNLVTKYRDQFSERHKLDGEWREQARESTSNYYRITNAAYRLIFGDNLHHAPVMPWDTYKSAATKQNYRMAVMIEAKPTDKIADFGCGWGLSSRDIAEISYAHVTGINITKMHLDHCRQRARELGMENLLTYVNEDYTNTSFPDHTFDKVYSMEATCHCPCAEAVYGEAFRVLKPGGLVALQEAATLDTFDKENPYHVELLRRVMFTSGVHKVRTTKENIAALKNVGFEILMEEDYSVPCQNRRKPIYTMFRDPRYLHVLLRLCIWLMWVGEKVGILKKGTYDSFNILREEADSLAQAMEIGIITVMQMIVARKPHAK